jgi:aromatic amino acid transport protein AroP
MLLAYVIGGVIELLIMRQLGEMIVEEPVAGSFAHFAHKYWGELPGFLSGWNYWVLYALVGMTELTAVSKYVHYWLPEVPAWCVVLAFFTLVNAINLASVRVFGEAEFWFSLIKVLAVAGMITGGVALLVSGTGAEHGAALSNLWALEGGVFPGGFKGFAIALALIMFSFGGLELVGVSAAETGNPEKTIPRAINQVLWRILLFYVGAVAVMLLLKPWPELVAGLEKASVVGDDYGASPFVLIAREIGLSGAAHILNFVILTAALSVYNSGVYCNSRMLYGRALKGAAPGFLSRVDARGVPARALFVSALGTGAAVVVNYLMPQEAFELLVALVVAALVLNWALISLTHLRFAAALRREGRVARFRAIGAPFTNYVCLVFVAGILAVIAAWTDRWVSVALLPFWLMVLAGTWWVFVRKRG